MPTHIVVTKRYCKFRQEPPFQMYELLCGLNAVMPRQQTDTGSEHTVQTRTRSQYRTDAPQVTDANDIIVKDTKQQRVPPT